MKRVPYMLLHGVLLLMLGCGRSESQVSRHAAWPGSWATGSLMNEDVPFCSATLVAPNVVVTSGRCARAALGGNSYFRWRRGMVQFDTPVRQGHVLVHGDRLASGGAWLAPADSQQQRSLVRGIQRHCRIKDMFALTRSVSARECLDAIQPALLVAAGGMGLAGWHDVGWLGLQDAVPTEPAQWAQSDASDSLQAGAGLRRIGVYRASGLRASPLQRYEHEYRLYEVDDTEMHAGPETGRTHDDLGSGLWTQTFVSGAWQWQLVGVGSRPFVAHSDTSAGMIFSRLDHRCAAMREALQRLQEASTD